MSSSDRPRRRGRPQKVPNRQAPPTPSETSSDPASKAHTAPEKKTREKVGRAVAQHSDSKSTAVSPLSPVLHTHAPARNGHLTQNSSRSVSQRGRKKQSKKKQISDISPDERSDAGVDPDTTRTEQQNARITPSPPPSSSSSSTLSPSCTQGLSATKVTSTHATLTCPGSPQDTPVSPPKCDLSVGTPKTRRGRPPRPRLSSTPQRSRTPQSQLHLSPITKTLPKRVRSQNPEAQQRKRPRKKAEHESREKLPVKRQRKKRSAKAELPPSQRMRTRFVLEDPEHHEPEETTSDLSIELSVQEDNLSLTQTLSLDDEEDEEDEELPSVLQRIRQKPFSIREGLCVWCKLRKYPFWPAIVKSVNRKTKKASIVFIDQFLIDKKSISKGLSVSLRTLKPFDCEEYKHFVDIAKEQYGESFTLCMELISDYNIRIGCGSFVGSIIEYVADDISQPLRSQYLKASSDLLSPTQCLMEQQDEESELQDLEDHTDLQDFHVVKKVLPDRTQAARNRANQRLVDYIVKKRGAQDRLLAVISGQQASRWLQDLHSSSRSVVGQVYLEDEEQVDAVYCYLEELCQSAARANRGLEKSDRIRYILDVLFPEALICAISAVDSVSLDKAEEKYRQGPRHSNRERQEFDQMIEQQMKRRSADWCP